MVANLAGPAELRFHRASRLDGLVAGIDIDVAPAHHRAMRDVALQLHPVRKPDRQRAGLEARRSRHQPAPDRIAAFAVEHFARAQIALGDRGDVAAKAMRLPGRLAAQRRGENRDVQLEPDQMITLFYSPPTPP